MYTEGKNYLKIAQCVTKIPDYFHLTVFLKHGQLDFSKASDSIYDYLKGAKDKVNRLKGLPARSWAPGGLQDF